MAHRTQLILEEWQYDGARAIAESSGVSLASVVREAVGEYLSHRDTARGSSLEELTSAMELIRYEPRGWCQGFEGA